MASKRKVHSPKFKSKVAISALRERESLSELAQKYELNPNQISQWKQKALHGMEDIFTQQRGVKSKEEEELVNRLYQQIGQLQVELDWLKKKSGL